MHGGMSMGERSDRIWIWQSLVLVFDDQTAYIFYFRRWNAPGTQAIAIYITGIETIYLGDGHVHKIIRTCDGRMYDFFLGIHNHTPFGKGFLEVIPCTSTKDEREEEKEWFFHICRGLFGADGADDEGDAVYLFEGEIEGTVGGILAVDGDVAFELGGLDALQERSLARVDDVCLAPLEPEAVERYAAAGYDVAGGIAGKHTVALYADEKLGTLEGRDDVFFAVVVHIGDIGTSQGSSHRVDGDKRQLHRGLRSRWGRRDVLKHGTLTGEEPGIR